MTEVVVTDDTRAEIAAMIADASFIAAREFPCVGTEEFPTPWDLRHQRIDDLLTDYFLAAE